MPARDVAALAKTISLLLGDSGMRLVLGENGKNRILNNFSLEGMIENYRKLYEGIVRTTIDSANSDDI